MIVHRITLFWLTILFVACNSTSPPGDRHQWETEVVAAEQAFCEMAQAEGLAKAFAYYAAENGVLRRGNRLVEGKAAIAAYYAERANPNATLTWKPTFVDISAAGDLAYTYGQYVYTAPDSTGAPQESTGIFHTVWKRQADGAWRFVWD